MPTALLGLLAWLGVAVWLGTGLGDDVTLAELIVAVVALVVVPLLLPLTIPRDRSHGVSGAFRGPALAIPVSPRRSALAPTAIPTAWST